MYNFKLKLILGLPPTLIIITASANFKHNMNMFPVFQRPAAQPAGGRCLGYKPMLNLPWSMVFIKPDEFFFWNKPTPQKPIDWGERTWLTGAHII